MRRAADLPDFRFVVCRWESRGFHHGVVRRGDPPECSSDFDDAETWGVGAGDAEHFAWPAGNGQKRLVGESLLDLMSANGWPHAGAWTRKAAAVAPTLVRGLKKAWRPRSWACQGQAAVAAARGGRHGDREQRPVGGRGRRPRAAFAGSHGGPGSKLSRRVEVREGKTVLSRGLAGPPMHPRRGCSRTHFLKKRGSCRRRRADPLWSSA